MHHNLRYPANIYHDCRYTGHSHMAPNPIPFFWNIPSFNEDEILNLKRMFFIFLYQLNPRGRNTTLLDLFWMK